MKTFNAKVKVIDVKTVKGSTICRAWKRSMQVVFTDKGIFVDTMKFAWFNEIGKTLPVKLKFGVDNMDDGKDNWIEER